MATTKSAAAIWSGETFTAGSAHADSSVQTITTGYGAELNIKITNGATGPTVALGLQIQTSTDNSEFYDYGGPLIGKTGNSEVASWGSIPIEPTTMYVKIINYQTNTGQNVTVDADISEIDGV